MLDTAIDILTAIGTTTGVRLSATVYIGVSASHVLGIAFLIGPIVLVDLWLLGIVRSLGAEAIVLLRTTAKIGVALAIATGVLLLSANPDEYARNAIVWWKLAVIALALANALAFEMLARRGVTDGLAISTRRAFGATSLALWLTALVLGRTIAFA